MADIRAKMAYDPPSDDYGLRALTYRLWPRGVSKGDLRTDLWARDAAPSDGLKKGFAHDPEGFGWFREKCLEELDGSPWNP